MALYNFLSGKIRVLENTLLTQTDVDRMVDAPDFDTAFKALADTDYGAHLLNLEPNQFKQALEADIERVRELMVQWITQSELLEFMFLRYDAHNLKLYLKRKANDDGSDVDEYASGSSLTAGELMKQRIVDNQSGVVLHPAVEQLVSRSLDLLDAEPSAFEIDSAVDLALFELLDERMKAISNSILRDLYTIQKQTVYTKAFLRAKRMNMDASAIKNLLPDNWLRHYNLDEAQAVDALPLEPQIRTAYQKYLEHKQLWELEKELEEAELVVIRSAKLQSGGPEPVVGYFYGKQNAARNVRLILTAKQNEIPANKIKERVRDLY